MGGPVECHIRTEPTRVLAFEDQNLSDLTTMSSVVLLMQISKFQEQT